MNRISLKLKVTLWYTLIMIIISAVVLAAMSSISRDIIHRDIEMRLTKTVTDMSHMLSAPGARRFKIPNHMFYENGIHMAIYDTDYNITNGSMPFGIDDKLSFEEGNPRIEIHNGNKYCVYDRRIPDNNSGKFLWIKGMVSISDEILAVRSAAKNNITLTLMLILFAGLGGYLILNRAFVPVNKIRRTAAEISESSDLSERINIGKGKDEIHALANTFDRMLDKIQSSFEKEKQFTSDASHELRTPIAVIMSECEYIESCGKTVEDITPAVASIKKQTEKMSRLISQLLTISRMDKNTLQTNFEDIYISELLSFVCDEQEDIHDDTISLIRNITPGITAKADRFLLARLFINLISNAYSYNKESGFIKVSLESRDGMVILTVADNGIGISDDDKDKIWERFYQVDPSRSANEDGSMGLGLSMVKWIAECHNGSVSVNSRLGEGSEFVFEFPRCNP